MHLSHNFRMITQWCSIHKLIITKIIPKSIQEISDLGFTHFISKFMKNSMLCLYIVKKLNVILPFYESQYVNNIQHTIISKLPYTFSGLKRSLYFWYKNRTVSIY